MPQYVLRFQIPESRQGDQQAYEAFSIALHRLTQMKRSILSAPTGDSANQGSAPTLTSEPWEKLQWVRSPG